jgi:hypothetical protein
MSKIKIEEIRSETYKVVKVDKMSHSATPDLIRLIFGSLRAGHPIKDKDNNILWEDVSETELVFDYKSFKLMLKDLINLDEWIEKEREKKRENKK